METFMHYLLLIIITIFPLSLLFIRKRGSKNLPPGSSIWPVENVALIFSGYQKFIRDRMHKHSVEGFKTSFTGEKSVVLCGAQGNKFIFTNDNKLVIPWLPPSLKKVMLPDFADSNFKQALMIFHKFQYEALKPETLKQYIPMMDALARERLDHDWNPNSVVKVFPSSKRYTFELVCRVFMNVVDPERLSKLLDPFTVLVKGMVSVPIDFPGTAYRRAARAGKLLRGELRKIVEQRRKEMMMMEDDSLKGQDMLTKLVLLCDEDGNYMSDAKVANFFVIVLLASHDSTTAAATGVINFLAQLPHIYEQVLEEQMEIAKGKGPNELLTWGDTEKMKYSWNVVRETLRLLPPAPGGFREALVDLSYQGFTIPKGWKTYWTAHSTHKNPDYFPDPEKFDPSRFEGRGPAPYTFVPFGGGPKMCPGREFARLAILVLVHNVVTRFRLEKAIPNEKMLFHAAVRPAHDLPVHLHPHEK